MTNDEVRAAVIEALGRPGVMVVCSRRDESGHMVAVVMDVPSAANNLKDSLARCAAVQARVDWVREAMLTQAIEAVLAMDPGAPRDHVRRALVEQYERWVAQLRDDSETLTQERRLPPG